MMLASKANRERSFKPSLVERAEAEPGELPRLVLGTLGYPGSGKTTFGRQLADRIDGLCLDVDAIKEDLKKQPATEANRDHWQTRYRELRQSAIDSGRLIIGANQHNELAKRREIATWAKSLGYQFAIVWVKTPREVALERVFERGGSGPGFSSSERVEISKHIDWISANFDPPAADELVVEIDGQADFASQYQAFEDFWQQLSDPASNDQKN